MGWRLMLTHECDYISKKNFKIVPVVDICKISLGGTPSTRIKEFWGGKIQWATAKDIVSTHERFISATERTITQLAIAKSNAKIFPEKTIVITSRGTVGAIALLGIPMAFNQTCYGLNPNEKNDPLYIYYALKNSLDKMLSLSYGTVFQTITMKTFSELKIPVPSVSEQQSIAKILSDLDEKIELNNEMNKTLEEIAQAIFKRWFIDFEFPNENGDPYKSSGGEMVESELGMIPKGCSVGKLRDICKSIMNGGTPSRKEIRYWENGVIPWYKTGELMDNFLLDSKEHITEEGLKKSSCHIWEPETILIALYASPTLGRLGILGSKATANQACSGLVAKDHIGFEYLFLVLLNHREVFNSIAVGSAQQNISQSIVSAQTILIPNKELLDKFRTIVNPIFNSWSINTKETALLKEIRDLLLPKLMTGKIRVPLED